MEILNINKPEDVEHLSERIIVIGDPHIGRFKSIDQFREFYVGVLKPFLTKETVLIFVGDQFDGGAFLETILLCDTIDVFNEIAEEIMVAYFIIGNHDTWKNKDIHYNNSKIFTIWKDKFRLIEYGVEDVFGKKIAFLSFNVSTEETIKKISELDGDYSISHTDITNLKLETGRNIDFGVGVEHFSKYKLSFNGHIHKRQILGNVINVGSPYQMKFSDRGGKNGIHVIDPKTDGIFFYENHISPKYYSMSFAELVEMGENELLVLGGSNVFIHDADNEAAVYAVLGDIKPKLLDIELKSIDTSFDVTEVVHNLDDVGSDVTGYLSENRSISLKSGVVELTDEDIERIQNLSKNI